MGFLRIRASYKVGSRYNGLYIPRKIVQVEALLVNAGYIEELPHFHSRAGEGRSYTTRIRHTDALRKLFSKLTIDLHDIDTHADEECIILHDKYVDDPDDDINRKIEYKDEELSSEELALVNTMRDQLRSYNNLLKHTFIDIPSYKSSTFTRIIKQGKYAGRKQVISIGPDKKFVTRVFNKGLAAFPARCATKSTAPHHWRPRCPAATILGRHAAGPRQDFQSQAQSPRVRHVPVHGCG